MLTFWGSDLLQTAGLETYQAQLELLNKANLITIQSLDMREILLAKYGRALKDKVRLSFYGIADARFDHLDRGRNNLALQAQLRREWNIPADKIVVIIGYAGAKGMQHLAVLKELETLPPEERNGLHLVFPMTYGNSDAAYFEAVKQALAKTPFGTTHLTTYLSDEQIGIFYNLADLFINVRETDACNASMLELMYLNKVCIVGSWLPYGLVRREGIRYIEIDEIGTLVPTLQQLWKQPNWKEQFINRTLVRDAFGHTVAIARWEALFKELEQL